MQVTLQYAQEHLSELVHAAHSGEAVEIAGAEEASVTLVPSVSHVPDQIGALPKAAEKQQQFHDETAWIAANRAQFAGRWIALVGANLLAVGDSAKEVFQTTAHTIPTPLILRLDPEALPFAGW